jgi:hypothetical protein
LLFLGGAFFAGALVVVVVLVFAFFAGGGCNYGEYQRHQNERTRLDTSEEVEAAVGAALVDAFLAGAGLGGGAMLSLLDPSDWRALLRVARVDEESSGASSVRFRYWKR